MLPPFNVILLLDAFIEPAPLPYEPDDGDGGGGLLKFCILLLLPMLPLAFEGDSLPAAEAALKRLKENEDEEDAWWSCC